MSISKDRLFTVGNSGNSFKEQNNNPFYFHFSDSKMDKNKAANYIPPSKRKEIKAYLTKASIKLSHPCIISFLHLL